jgi:hypothetical protein
VRRTKSGVPPAQAARGRVSAFGSLARYSSVKTEGAVLFHNLGNLGRGEPLQVSALAHVLRLIARWRRPRLPTNIVLVVSTIAGLALAGTAIAQPARNADSAAQDDRSDRIQAEENSIDDANSAAQDR